MLPTSRRLLGRAIRPSSASVTNSSRAVRPAFAAAPFSTQSRSQQAVAQDLHKTPSPVDQFATGNNAYYAEEMYRLWKQASCGKLSWRVETAATGHAALHPTLWQATD